MDRLAFLDQEAPPGYVAGVGRGATGFTTSADTGPVKFESTSDTENENGLLSTKANDKDDEEADRIYEAIERRLKRKQAAEMVPVENKVETQFTDLKRALGLVKEDEWVNLPEVGDATRKNKRARLLEQSQQRTYALPDSVIGGMNEATDFLSIASAKGQLLSQQLDSLVDSRAETHSQEHLDALEEEGAQYHDIQKGRSILASLRRTQPHKATSWMASARLEELAKKLATAIKLIEEGCRKLPYDEELWLENIRLHQKTSDGALQCRAIVNEGLRYNSESEQLWLKAHELENPIDVVSRKRVLMKGLEYLPRNVALWKKLVDVENDEEDAKKLLQKAVELCPEEWDLWLSLINVSSYKESRDLLNRARKAMRNHHIWITALKLEERENDNVSLDKLTKMLTKGIQGLPDVDTNVWLEEAETAHNEGFLKTTAAIVSSALASEEVSVLLQLVNKYDGSKTVKHHIYQVIIDKNPSSFDTWLKLILGVKAQAVDNRLWECYERAVALNPAQELFALMYAKDKWLLDQDEAAARKILTEASERVPDSEEIALARIKVEAVTGNYEESLKLSKQSLESLQTERLWYRHIHLLRVLTGKSLATTEEVLEACDKAVGLFPESYRLYLQKSQVLLEKDEAKAAREVLSVGTKKCSRPELWVEMARIDSNVLKSLIRARSTLDTAILKLPTSDLLWQARIRLEKYADPKAATQMANRALKVFPKSPIIWVQYLATIPKMSQRKTPFIDGIRQTDNSPVVLRAIGVFFWLDGKFSKSKTWFERSLDSDKTDGDTWAWHYALLQKTGSDEEKSTFLKHFSPQYESINKGEAWNSVNKHWANFERKPAEILDLVAKLVTETDL